MNRANDIFEATWTGDTAHVRRLLDADAALADAQDELRETPLHHAAARGDVSMAELLLAYGADVNGRCAGTRPAPIVRAAENNRREMVKLLIAWGADVRRGGGQPMHAAGPRGHRDVCRLLVEAGAVDDRIQPHCARRLSLFRAAYGYDAEGLAALLAADATLVHSLDVDGRTPLHVSAAHGDAAAVRILLGAQADLHARDHRGETPFDRAAGYGHQEVVHLLLEAGATCDLFTAIEFGAVGRAAALLDEDGSLVQAGYFRGTALDYAIAFCQKAIVRLLLERGADDPGDRGRCFLHGEAIQDRDLTAAMLQNVNLQDSVFRDVDCTGATFSHVSFAGARFMDASFAGADIDTGTLSGLTIWGIEVVPLLRAELARRRRERERV
jgi:ankyrin repeat protein